MDAFTQSTASQPFRSRAAHAFHVQGFQGDHLVLVSEPSGDLTLQMQPGFLHFAVAGGDPESLFAVVDTPFLFPC